MKLLKNKSLYLLVFIFLTGCASTDKRNVYSPGNYEKNLYEKSHQDGEVIAFLNAFNNQEINLARKLKSKLNNHDLKALADAMIAEHTLNLHQTRKISQEIGVIPHESAKIAALSRAGEQEITHLEALPHADVEGSFVNTMIQNHENALIKIDALLTQVKNPLLRKQLENTRHHVLTRLEKAKKLQEKVHLPY